MQDLTPSFSRKRNGTTDSNEGTKYWGEVLGVFNFSKMQRH